MVMQFFRSLQKTISSDLNPVSLRGRLVREAGWIFLIWTAASVLGLVSSMVIARILGSYSFGLYSSVMAWQGLIGVFAGLGLGIYILKKSSQTRADNVPLLVGWADRWLLLSGLIGGGALVLLGMILPFSQQSLLLFVAAAPLPFLGRLIEVRKSALRGLGRTVLSQWPPMVLAPLVVLAGISLHLLLKIPITAYVIVLYNIFSLFLVLLVYSLRLKARYKGWHQTSHKVSIRAALPFVLVSALVLMNQRIDIIILGILGTQYEVGLYAVASKGSEVVNYSLVIVNTVIAQRLAASHKDGDIGGMQRMLTASVRRAFTAASVPAIALILFGSPILVLLYGREYAAASSALSILAFAQLLNVGSGSVAMVLNMTDGEKIVAMGVGTAVIINIVLNWILIPLYSIQGAALATGISLIAWNIILVLCVRKRLNLRPTVIGL